MAYNVTNSILKTLPFANLRNLLIKSELVRRFSGGVLWILIGTMGWRFLSAVSSIIVARILGTEGFGELGMVRSTINMFSVLAGLRLGSTATKYVSEFRRKDPEKAAVILKLSLFVALFSCGIMAILCLASSVWVARYTMNRPELASALALGSLFLFFNLYGTVKEYALMGFEAFKSAAILNLFRGLTLILFCVPAAIFLGVDGVILAISLSALSILWLVTRFLHKERDKFGFRKDIRFSEFKNEMPVLWHFTLPSLLAFITLALAMWIGNIILARQEEGYIQLGIYHAANQWRIFVLFLPAVLSKVNLPILSELHGRDSKCQFNKAISIQFRLACLIALPFTLLLIGLSEPLVSFFGKGFYEGRFVLPVLAVSVFFTAISQILGRVFDSAGHVWIRFLMFIAWAVVFLCVCLLLVPKRGAIALATAYLLSYAALVFVQLLYIEFILARRTILPNVKIFLFSLLVLGACYWINRGLSGTFSVLLTIILFLAATTYSILSLKKLSDVK